MSSLPGRLFTESVDDGISETSWAWSQSEANPAIDAPDGLEAVYPKPRLSDNGKRIEGIRICSGNLH